MRVWLAGLIVLPTVGFVIGTSIERHNSNHESAAQVHSEAAATHSASTEPGAESAAIHAAEGGGEGAKAAEAPKASEGGQTAAIHAAESHGTTTGEAHKELRPLGVSIEAVPFIVLASLASLALAALAWMRPRWLLGLLLVAGAMAVFGALDVREAFHQSDEHKTGLVILAAVIATLHLAAAGLAAAMAARRSAPSPPAAAGTITA
jgi:hypothetical protein